PAAANTLREIQMIQMRKIVAPLLMPIALTQAIACSQMSPANKSLYALQMPAPATATIAADRVHDANVSADRIVQVRRVNIAQPFDGPSLVYRTQQGTFVKDYYNQWVAPPEEIFSTELVEFLSASGSFGSVV